MPRQRKIAARRVSPLISMARGRRHKYIHIPLHNSSTVLLKSEVKRLEQVVQELTDRVPELEREAEVAKAVQQCDVIHLREISKEQAREEIIHAFESGEPLGQGDLADALSLEISLVVEVCNELIEEGVVVFYDDGRS